MTDTAPTKVAATVREDVPLEGGAILRAGTTVYVWMQKEDYSGIEWRDSDGSHSMAIPTEKIEATA